jgi:hypothetical protein
MSRGTWSASSIKLSPTYLDRYLSCSCGCISAWVPHDCMRSTRSIRYEVARLTSPSVTTHGYQSGHSRLKIGTNSTESLARMEFLWERIHATGHYLCSRTSWRDSEPVIRTAPRTLLGDENSSRERQYKAREEGGIDVNNLSKSPRALAKSMRKWCLE